MRHALLLGDPQSPFGIGGGRRRVVAKDVNKRGKTQRCGVVSRRRESAMLYER
jgi:hypothetical protein